ncbi:MAG: multicopper oxidase family protein [Xanthobacteraceae bacterium]
MTASNRLPHPQPSLLQPSRRQVLLDTVGLAASLTVAGWPIGVAAQSVPVKVEPDYTLRLTPVSLELAPNKVIKTFGFNGMAPGPVLRLREGRSVSIAVVNETDVDDIVHWHGLFIPSEVDGAMEEGSPMVPKGGSKIYSFTPRPSGTRWYHSHNMAGQDLSRSTYSGLFGFMLIEPTNDPGNYDREVLLAAHHWEGSWVSMQDLRKGPPPDNGLEVLYASASFNDKMLGHGEPVRVRQGERVLFRLLNASASRNITVALPGHQFTVVALDGNPVLAPRTLPVIALAPGERADAVVEMNRPGIWVLGAVNDEDRGKGLGAVVEYASERGEPQWSAPAQAEWDYSAFGASSERAEPDQRIELRFDKIPGGRGGYNRWTINGKSWPDTNPMLVVQKGKRYRLAMTNNSGDNHPVHLHRHTFEVMSVGDKHMPGLMKDTLNMTRFSKAEIDFIADNPGDTLFHCHHQDHQDEGFMGLIRYG